MAPDLETLLEQTAPTPRRPVDTGALISRVRRRRRVRRIAGGATSLAVLVLVVVIAVPALGPPAVELIPADRSPDQDATPTERAAPASQTPSEAERDGVVPAIADLPFALRVGVEERVPAPEGVWVRSRLSDEVLERARRDGCAIGAFDDPRALDGRDAVCADDYGEVLLLDAQEERILRAVPLPYVPAQHLLLTDEALYCARQGDGALPDSMLCRIDRTSLDALVRIYPWPRDSLFDGTTNLWTPPWWAIEDPVELPSVIGPLELTDDGQLTTGSGPRVVVDPDTVELPVELPRDAPD